MKTTATRTGAVSQSRGFGDLLYDKAGSRPILDLDFAGTQSLKDKLTGKNLVTYTRSSNGTYIDSAGIIKTSLNNAPRFTHDPTTLESLGLLIEESRVNKAKSVVNLYTNNKKADLSADTSVTAPDGTTTAYKLVPNTDNATHWRQSGQISLTGGKYYSYSLFVKPDYYKGIVLGIQSNCYATFNLDTGAVTGSHIDNVNNSSEVSAEIIAYTNGWYRCVLKFLKVNSENKKIQVYVADSATNNIRNPSFTGNGTNKLWIWGSQLEEESHSDSGGAFPTSYIYTTDSEVTRAADLAEITGDNFTGIWSTTANTMYCEVNYTAKAYYPRMAEFVSLDAGGDAYAQTLMFDHTDNKLIGRVYTQAGLQLNEKLGTVFSDDSTVKGVNAYELNNGIMGANGVLSSADTSLALHVTDDTALADKLVIGGGFTSTHNLNNTVKRFTHWTTRIPDQSLINITQ